MNLDRADDGYARYPMDGPSFSAEARDAIVAVHRRLHLIAARLRRGTEVMPATSVRRRIAGLLMALNDSREVLSYRPIVAPPLHPDDLAWMRGIGDAALVETASRAHMLMDEIDTILNAHDLTP